MGPSFATIAGYKGHGAIIHYEPTIETDIPLEPDGIFLLDSGGQYLDGTTDITRTVSLGNPGREEKQDFTALLILIPILPLSQKLPTFPLLLSLLICPPHGSSQEKGIPGRQII